MGWSDPDVIAQMEANAQERPEYERSYEASLSMCDELERSPVRMMRVTAKISRVIAEQMLELRRATEKLDVQASAEIITGILTAMAGGYSLLLDVNDQNAATAIRSKFEQIVARALDVRRTMRNAGHAPPDNNT